MNTKILLDENIVCPATGEALVLSHDKLLVVLHM